MSKTSNLKILGIDLAPRNTGYALCNAKGPYKKHIGILTTSNKVSVEENFIQFSNDLIKLIDSLNSKYPIDYIIVESTPIVKNYDTTYLMISFEALVRYILYLKYGDKYKDKVHFVSVSEVRKVLSLKDKEAVFNYYNKKYKLNFKKFSKTNHQNDITDAIALAMYGFKHFEERK